MVARPRAAARASWRAASGRWVGAYELLTRTARRADDEATAAIAERILAEERMAAERVAGTWDAATEAALATQDVHAPSSPG